MEKILSIEEVIDSRESEDYYGWDGYKITTSQQSIFLLIDNSQNCCESWGYMVSEDDLSYFIGAELLSIERVKEDGEIIESLKSAQPRYDNGDAVFVNVNTSRGKLQFALYNHHNGYYGHTVSISSKQVSFTEWV